MEYTIQITDDPQIINVTITGKWNQETDRAMGLEIMAKVEESKVGKVLVDMRELQFELPMINLFERAKELREQRRGFKPASRKVALVYKPKHKQMEANLNFFEDSSQNRGLPYQVFKQLEPALEWLKK